jgi:dihydroorotate dehydrogenase
MITRENSRKAVSNDGLDVPLEDLLRDFERFLGQMKDKEAKEEASHWLATVEEPLPQDEASRTKLLHELIRLCVRGRLQLLLAAYRIPHPSYNYFEDFEENTKGPWDSPPRAWQASTPALWSVLGFDIGFPIGIPASALTASPRWIDYYARCGFNILTYKTVRSKTWLAHPNPNWIFLNELDTPLTPGEPLPVAVGDQFVWPGNPKAFSMANSFGVPSSDPRTWQKDVGEALQRLRSDQLLIVSVVGMYEEYQGEELAADFAQVAKLVEEIGASAIELNLSCPNSFDPVTKKIREDLICESPETTARIVRKVRDRLQKNTKLVIKIGHMRRELLEQVVVPLASEIDGVSGINTLQMEVRKADGSPAFIGTVEDPTMPRTRAGVSGVAIREYGLQFVRWLAEIRYQYNLNFDIIGMGGVMNAEDVSAYQRAGANAVQTATAAFFNPALPQQVNYRLLGSAPTLETQLVVRSRVLELLDEGPMSLRELSKQLSEQLNESEQLNQFFGRERLIAEKTRALLQGLEEEGRVTAARESGRVVFRSTSAADVGHLREPVR